MARPYSAPLHISVDFEQWFVDNTDSLITDVPLDDVFYDHQLFDTGCMLISSAGLGPPENLIATTYAKIALFVMCNTNRNMAIGRLQLL